MNVLGDQVHEKTDHHTDHRREKHFQSCSSQGRKNSGGSAVKLFGIAKTMKAVAPIEAITIALLNLRIRSTINME